MIFLDFFGLFVWLSLANYHFSTQSNRKKNDGHIFLIFSVMFYSNDLSFIYIYIYMHITVMSIWGVTRMNKLIKKNHTSLKISFFFFFSPPWI